MTKVEVVMRRYTPNEFHKLTKIQKWAWDEAGKQSGSMLISQMPTFWAEQERKPVVVKDEITIRKLMHSRLFHKFVDEAAVKEGLRLPRSTWERKK